MAQACVVITSAGCAIIDHSGRTQRQQGRQGRQEGKLTRAGSACTCHTDPSGWIGFCSMSIRLSAHPEPCQGGGEVKADEDTPQSVKRRRAAPPSAGNKRQCRCLLQPCSCTHKGLDEFDFPSPDHRSAMSKRKVESAYPSRLVRPSESSGFMRECTGRVLLPGRHAPSKLGRTVVRNDGEKAFERGEPVPTARHGNVDVGCSGAADGEVLVAGGMSTGRERKRRERGQVESARLRGRPANFRFPCDEASASVANLVSQTSRNRFIRPSVAKRRVAGLSCAELGRRSELGAGRMGVSTRQLHKHHSWGYTGSAEGDWWKGELKAETSCRRRSECEGCWRE